MSKRIELIGRIHGHHIVRKAPGVMTVRVDRVCRAVMTITIAIRFLHGTLLGLMNDHRPRSPGVAIGRRSCFLYGGNSYGGCTTNADKRRAEVLMIYSAPSRDPLSMGP